MELQDQHVHLRAQGTNVAHNPIIPSRRRRDILLIVRIDSKVVAISEHPYLQACHFNDGWRPRLFQRRAGAAMLDTMLPQHLAALKQSCHTAIASVIVRQSYNVESSRSQQIHGRRRGLVKAPEGPGSCTCIRQDRLQIADP
jgi:hypothetical protein